jgi:uncharacterized protein
MPIIYIDADACPVKEEVYRVARRYKMRVLVVARTFMRTPTDPLIELVERDGFGVVDDWIAEQAGPGDIVITADIPLAARCPGDARIDGGPAPGRHRDGRPATDEAEGPLAIPVQAR